MFGGSTMQECAFDSSKTFGNWPGVKAAAGYAATLLRLAGLAAGMTLVTPSAHAQISLPSANHIDTVAGDGYWGYGGDGGLAIDAEFAHPGGIAVDSAGNLYIADTFNNVIRKVSASSGDVTTVAGNGTEGYAGDGQLATGAELDTPWGVAVDSAGNLYIADTNNSVVRRVDVVSHLISTVAGIYGTYSYTGDGGPATSATLEGPSGVALDSAGNLYIADSNNNVVRVVSPATQEITTVAGNGTAGYSGDGSLAKNAELNGPFGIALDQSGNLFIVDSNNNVIREVTLSNGTISTVAGNGTAGYSGNGGSPTSAKLNNPSGVAVDRAGNLCITDSNNNVVRMVTGSSPKSISTIAGNGTAGYSGDGGAATSAEFNTPVGVAADSSGNIYVTDYQNVVIRAVGSIMTTNTTTMPQITWAAPASITYGASLSGTQLSATANVAGTFAYIPSAGTVLTAGLQALNVVFTPTDTTHYSPAMSTVALTVAQASPLITWTTPPPIVYGLALSATQLNATANVPGTFSYTPGTGTVLDAGPQTLSATFSPADSLDYTSAIATVSLTVTTTPGAGIITTVAGDGYWGYYGDSDQAVDAGLEDPIGITVDSSRNLYIADSSNSANVVRKVNASTGIISTFAGNGTQGYSGDSGPATSAKLNQPGEVLADSSGNLYIADTGNNVIRKVAASTGIITTIAGNGTMGYSGDSGPATSAELDGPWGMALDASGNLYIADRYNERIRKVSGGTITTFAGNGTQGYSGDGAIATSAKLNTPSSLAFDSAGNLYIYDSFNNRIRKVAASNQYISTVAGTGTAGYSGNGGAATSAKLNLDAGLAVDAQGNIYISDTNNQVIRMVSASTGYINNFAGNHTAGYSGDGGPATSAKLHGPEDVAVDSLGNIFIADFENYVIREVGSSTSSAISVSVSPSAYTLYAGQQKQFTDTVTNTGNTAVTWSVGPSGSGTVSSSGLYTAPATINSTQTVTLTATSQADSTRSASATVTLMPTIGVSVTPPTATLYGGQTQQFTSTVTNTTNTAVTWSVSPSGTGSVNSSGLYTAPSSATTQLVVTVTATSQADTTKSASAIVYLLPPCVSNGYGYARSIAINHTKVPNTDQTNFPFLFSSTDPSLKSTANGGHVTSSNGYDIIFSTDPKGLTKLDDEVEEYNPAAGQLIAWVRIPTVSHTTDTVVYLFYGNSSITSSQQNPTGVWDTNFAGVWHLPNGTTLSANDSTAHGDNGVISNASAAPAIIYGGASFNGTSSNISQSNLPAMQFSSDFTVSFWLNAAQWGGVTQGVIGQKEGDADNGWQIYNNSIIGTTRMGIRTAGESDFFSNTPVSVGTWQQWTFVEKGGIGYWYLNGAVDATGAYASAASSTSGLFYMGLAQTWSGYYKGLIDEVQISSAARSGDWIATEFNNEEFPSAFYLLDPEETVAVSPAAVDLYASQSNQFTAIGVGAGTCNSIFNWSMPLNSPGTLSGNGFYSAPGTISAPQTIIVTATSQTDSTKSGTAEVHLLPAPLGATLSLVASTQSPYVTGTAEQFVATLTTADGIPISGVTVNFTVVGVNATTGSATTNAYGSATFTYTGGNSGSDTIQATASISGVPATSKSISASWLVPIQQISTSTVVGRFFQSPNNSGPFDISPNATPAFIQTFPTINFNPPSGTVLGNTSSVGVNTHPFTDVTTDLNGSFTGTIVAQGNGYQAGCPIGVNGSCNVTAGDMSAFQAVFTGTFTVPSPGNVTFDFYTDDGFILGIANGASRVSGASYNLPSVTPFEQYPVMGGIDSGNSASGNQVVVNFPAAGTYPFELDYTECCGPPLVLTMTQGASSPTGIAPTGSLVLSPNSLAPLPVGSSQSFTVLASDGAGNPVPNLSVGLVIQGADNEQLSESTNPSGMATFNYQDINPGTANVQAVAFISGMVSYSNTVSVPWTASPSSATGSGSSGTLNVSIDAPNTLVLPSLLSVGGSVTDSSLPSGDTITTTWSEVTGPGTVTFANAALVSTTASFSKAGSYVLKLTANDVNGSASAHLTVAVDPEPGTNQGWIGSPAYGAKVSGIVPITVASGETLTSGVLTYYPANSPTSVTTLNTNTTGSVQIGTFDTTNLNNGTYWITLQATDSSGNSEYNLALVSVVGNNKPGRLTSTVTDLVVPVKGLAIQIQRTYDSLNQNISGDFGYGWNLGTNVNLTVDPQGDVTFTLGGVRKTFYLTPQSGGWAFPFYFVAFTGEPGFHGTLTGSASGCADLFDYVVPDGNLWACIGGGYYNPPGYIYTDPTGTSYVISASGNLQSIVDKNGNMLTISSSGITSSTGLSVPFVRDSSNRITEITDPQGNHYNYSYDTNGNLVSVTYPNTSTSSTYSYFTGTHLYESGTDFNGNALPQTAYYGSTDVDPNGLPLNGRLKSVTDALSETTSYAYNLDTNTTAITYPPDGGGTVGTATMVYDTAGDLLTSTDPLGHTTTNVYDANRNLTSVTDPMTTPGVTTYTYDSNGNKTSVTYPRTTTSTNTTSATAFNQYSEPTSTTDELGNTRYFNYDVNFNPQSVTDGLGTLASFQFNTDGTMQAGAVGYDISSQPSRASQFTYDTSGNMASRTDALGRTTSYTYDSLGHKLTMTEPLPSSNTSPSAATTSYTYDDFGNLTQTSAPLGRVTSSQYDGNGNKKYDIDSRGHKTSYTYDALNRLTVTTFPDTTTDSKTYDFRGNVLTETDQAGHVTKNVYDLAGRLTSTTHAYGTSSATTTSYTYDNDGRKLTETDSLTHSTSYTYDAAGNLTGVSGVNGAFSYAYDNARNRVSMNDGNSHTTSYGYDARKRLLTTTYPDATSVTNAYDGPGNLISVTDQNEHVVEYGYDAGNQLQQVTQASSPDTSANTTVVGYDADGNPIALEDANTHTTATSFDLLGEVTGKTLPDGSLTESRSYDQNGNLSTLTHFNTAVTTYTYDSLNRLLSRATPSETTVSFAYTATGKRQTMTDASGTTNYYYDSMDRLTSKATPEGTLTYTYDAAGHLASMSSSNTNGVSLSYTYDTLNRLNTVVDGNLSSGHNTTTYTYDSANNVYTATYPNGVLTTFAYDPENRLTGLASSTLGTYAYLEDSAGKKTAASEPSGRSINWSYDNINRLIGETIGSAPSGKNGEVSYTLDPVGNRTSVTSGISGLSPVGGSFNPDDQLSAESYDQDGNVTATGGKTFTYNSQNQLITMGSTVSLIYDGDGNRVAKSVSGTITRYLVDDLNPTGYPQVVEELNSSGVVQRQYSYGLQRINERQIISSTWTPSFYAYDGMGTVRQLTNISGAVTDTYEYDAFGNEFTVSGGSGTPNEFLYRGEQYDPDLGLDYLRARYYNPITGRFISRDPDDPDLIDEYGNPTDPKELHKYLYAIGDPVNMTDPSGWSSEEYALPTGIIAIPSAKVLIGFGGTLACLTLWEAGNVWANSVVASNGGYVQQLPCFALPMSKGGKQKVSHNWVLDMARGMGKDVCSALKQIMQDAKRAGDSKLFRAAKATYKQVCRGYGG
jgi:RHS repeat-associated protein